MINTEVDWKELETALIELPEITMLRLSDIQWDKIRDLLINIDNKELELHLRSEVKYESETGDHIKRLATLCKQVYVGRLRLSEGDCKGVYISTNKISMYFVSLQSGDITILHHLVTQYQSWQVKNRLHLTELGSDDWALLAQLLPSLPSGVGVVEITSNSSSHPGRDTLRLLWDKTGYGWNVNNEGYEKRDDENFDKICNLFLPA